MEPRDVMLAIVMDLEDRRGIPSDLARGEDWGDARTAIVAEVDKYRAHVTKTIEAETVAKVVEMIRGVAATAIVYAKPSDAREAEDMLIIQTALRAMADEIVAKWGAKPGA